LNDSVYIFTFILILFELQYFTDNSFSDSVSFKT